MIAMTGLGVIRAAYIVPSLVTSRHAGVIVQIVAGRVVGTGYTVFVAALSRGRFGRLEREFGLATIKQVCLFFIKFN